MLSAALRIRIRRRLECFAADRRGSAAVLGAALIVVTLWCGAFAVDVGSLYFERRTAQGAVDLAAMAAARAPESAETAARATLEANGVTGIRALEVTPGRYRADPDVPAGERFTPGAGPRNAVRVRLRRDAPLHLAGALIGVQSMPLTTQATAATTKQAAFSIGSRLLRLEGGIANALLDALLGGNIELTLMDYRALAEAEIKLFRFMDALASELNLSAATYTDVLNAGATAGEIIDAMAAVSAAGGDAEAAGLLRRIGAATHAGGMSVPLAALIDAGPYANLATDSPSPGFDPAVNVMQMLTAAATAANGDSQVSIDLGAAVPGLADVRVDVAIGERPQGTGWVTLGERGASVRTAQTRLRITARVGGGLPGGAAVRVPLYAEIASARARLEAITCGPEPERDARVNVAARPGVAELWLGEVDTEGMSDFQALPEIGRARLLETHLARVTGESHAAMTNRTETILRFDRDDIREQRTKSTATRDAAETLLDSLLRDADVRVEVAGLGLQLPGTLRDFVADVLTSAAPPLNDVLNGVLEALGIALGEADVTVHGVRCDGAALVG